MGLRELMQIQAGVEVEEPETEDVNSLSYLRRIYRDPGQPIPVRMRAAIECLQYENGKVPATQNTAAEDKVKKMEILLQRIERAKVIMPLLIEGKCVNTSQVDGAGEGEGNNSKQ